MEQHSIATPKIQEQIEKLQQKYESMGQDLSSYLDGLLHANYLTYWDYIHLDTLLSLQNPKTDFPDEKIFIIYHQITELYFQLVLHELEQIVAVGSSKPDFFLERLRRINRYFVHLVDSFEVMVDGMDREQFLQFRMSLLPASGFQSVQYRKIEIMATHFRLLVDKNERERLPNDASIAQMFDHIYWKDGATELSTGKKTLTLKQFEQKYKAQLIELGEHMRGSNLYAIYHALGNKHELLPEIVEELRKFDSLVNINWPLSHYKSAVRYLQRSPEDIAATGGTNWQKYLPPRFQQRIFYPSLWSIQEKQDWGKGYFSDLGFRA